MGAHRDGVSHWDEVYAGGDASRSWFQACPRMSLTMLDAAGVTASDSLIDVGGGASRLAGALLGRGFRDITVLDISSDGGCGTRKIAWVSKRSGFSGWPLTFWGGSRCDPTCEWRHPAITRQDLRIILACDQGYQSSLAAANLQQLGLIHATDLDGGFTAWATAGLPLITPGHSQPQPARRL